MEFRLADMARRVAVIEPEVKALGFDLVRVVLFGKSEVGDEEHTLQIMAERPETGQLVIEDCAALSRRISDTIDALEEAGEVLIHDAYRLEVSSPGIDRPLTRPKDYMRWAGHIARLETALPVEGRRRFKGTLLGLEGDLVRLRLDDGKEAAVPLEAITRAKLELTDRLIEEHRLAAEGSAGQTH